MIGIIVLCTGVFTLISDRYHRVLYRCVHIDIRGKLSECLGIWVSECKLTIGFIFILFICLDVYEVQVSEHLGDHLKSSVLDLLISDS